LPRARADARGDPTPCPAPALPSCTECSPPCTDTNAPEPGDYVEIPMVESMTTFNLVEHLNVHAPMLGQQNNEVHAASAWTEHRPAPAAPVHDPSDTLEVKE